MLCKQQVAGSSSVVGSQDNGHRDAKRRALGVPILVVHDLLPAGQRLEPSRSMRGSAARGAVDVTDLDLNDVADVAAAALVGRDDEPQRGVPGGQRLVVFLDDEQDWRVTELRVDLASGNDDLEAVLRGEDKVSGTRRAGSLDDCAIRTDIMRLTPLASRPSDGSREELPVRW